MNYYDEIAKGYNELHEQEQLQKLDVVDELLKEIKGVKTILDVGCGTGISSDYFAEKGFVVTGIDPAKKLLEQNTNCLTEFVCAPAEAIPFEDKTFDLVISVTAIQNFEDLEKAFSEIKRVGKGNFILTYLKGVSKASIIDDAILNNFNVTKIIRDSKEIYYLIKRN